MSLFSNYQDITFLDNSVKSSELYEKELKQVEIKFDNNLINQTFRNEFQFYQFTKLNDLYLKFDLLTFHCNSNPNPEAENFLYFNNKASDFAQRAYTFIVNSIKKIDVRLGNNYACVTSDELNKNKINRACHMSFIKEERNYGLNTQQNTYSVLLVNKYDTPNNNYSVFSPVKRYKNGNYSIENLTNNYSKLYNNNITIEKTNNQILAYNKITRHVLIKLSDLDPFFDQDIVIPNSMFCKILVEFEFDINENFMYTLKAPTNPEIFYHEFIAQQVLSTEKDTPPISFCSIIGKKYWFREELINDFRLYNWGKTMEEKMIENTISLNYYSYKFYDIPLFKNIYLYEKKINWNYYLPFELIIFIKPIKKNNFNTPDELNEDSIIIKISDTKYNSEFNTFIVNYSNQPQNGFRIKRLCVNGMYKFEYENNDTEINYDDSLITLNELNSRVKVKKNNFHSNYNSNFIKFPITPNLDVDVLDKQPKQKDLNISIEFDSSVVYLYKNNSKTNFPISNNTYDYYLTIGLKYKNSGKIDNNLNISKTLTNF
jgi:hypothetical protein